MLIPDQEHERRADRPRQAPSGIAAGRGGSGRTADVLLWTAWSPTYGLVDNNMMDKKLSKRMRTGLLSTIDPWLLTVFGKFKIFGFIFAHPQQGGSRTKAFRNPCLFQHTEHHLDPLPAGTEQQYHGLDGDPLAGLDQDWWLASVKGVLLEQKYTFGHLFILMTHPWAWHAGGVQRVLQDMA